MHVIKSSLHVHVNGEQKSISVNFDKKLTIANKAYMPCFS